MTIEEAKSLRKGDYLVEIETGKRWKVNGAVRTWKREPHRVEVPLKHGLYRYGRLMQDTIQFVEKIV